ncbi:DUF3168 domain-containing protein [Rhodoferax sp. WC2427]|uniref:DUF3168 domain-containing protein n=1 Tax=Rhodoferax sp. WC2427 TaxID=3234144 RepID=UPI003466979F
MALETTLATLLGMLCSRVYPDIAGDPLPPRPYITYQQVGGVAVNFLERAVVGKRNARVQINVWADTRLAASALAGQVEDAIKLCTDFQGEPLAAWVAVHEPDLRLYGTRQDFTIWSPA